MAHMYVEEQNETKFVLQRQRLVADREAHRIQFVFRDILKALRLASLVRLVVDDFPLDGTFLSFFSNSLLIPTFLDLPSRSAIIVSTLRYVLNLTSLKFSLSTLFYLVHSMSSYPSRIPVPRFLKCAFSSPSVYSSSLTMQNLCVNAAFEVLSYVEWYSGCRFKYIAIAYFFSFLLFYSI